jgi:hypothetical protein
MPDDRAVLSPAIAQVSDFQIIAVNVLSALGGSLGKFAERDRVPMD